MLKTFVQYYKKVGHLKDGEQSSIDKLLFSNRLSNEQTLDIFLLLDDSNIMMLIKRQLSSKTEALKLLAEGLIHRKLFGIKKSNQPFKEGEIREVIARCANDLKMSKEICSKLVNLGQESSIVLQYPRRNSNSFKDEWGCSDFWRAVASQDISRRKRIAFYHISSKFL